MNFILECSEELQLDRGQKTTFDTTHATYGAYCEANFFSSSNPINTGGRIVRRSLSGYGYHGSNVDDPKEWFMDLEVDEEAAAVWVTPEEMISKTFAGSRKGAVRFVNRYKLNRLKVAELDMAAYEKLVNRNKEEFEQYDDMREFLANHLSNKGYEGWLATGGIGGSNYEDIAIFDGGDVDYDATSFKEKDGKWTDYLNEEDAKQWLVDNFDVDLDDLE